MKFLDFRCGSAPAVAGASANGSSGRDFEVDHEIMAICSIAVIPGPISRSRNRPGADVQEPCTKTAAATLWAHESCARITLD